MSRLFLLLTGLYMSISAIAQNGYGSTSIYDRTLIGLPKDTVVYTLPPNALWYETDWKDSVYKFKEFQDTRLVFANGFSPSTRLRANYNIFLETIDVTTATGEISAMKKLTELRTLIIGEHKFIYEPELGYLELVVEGNISIGSKTIMNCITELSSGYKYALTGFDVRTGRDKKTRYYWPREYYYIISADGKVHRPGTLTLPLLLPEYKNEIRDFVKEHKIDYRDNDDVSMVVLFCNNLSAQRHDDDRGSWKDSVYRFNQFMEAEIWRRSMQNTVQSIQARLNYDQLNGAMVTINKGDTVNIDVTNVESVQVGETLFLRDKTHGFIEVLLRGKVMLGMQRQIDVFSRTIAHVPDSVLHSKNEFNRGAIYKKEDRFFIIKGDRSMTASQQAVMWAFPGNNSKIREFVAANNTNFKSREDLLKLMSFCAQL
jgi:hypothetical protein